MVVPGTVTRTVDFGAFVELEPGLEGLVHISELSDKQVRQTTDVVKTGQAVQVRVLELDPANRRISLSIKSAAGAANSRKHWNDRAIRTGEEAKDASPWRARFLKFNNDGNRRNTQIGQTLARPLTATEGDGREALLGRSVFSSLPCTSAFPSRFVFALSLGGIRM